MRRKIAMGLLICFSMAMVGCSTKKSGTVKEDPKKIMVLAAASLTDVLTEIKEGYEQYQEEYTLEFSFDSSGTLKTQIEQGVDADVFLSASKLPMEELAKEGLVEEEGMVDLLKNEIVLISNSKEEAPITSFEELVKSDKVDMIATCMAEVPIGQYTIQLYENLGLSDKLAKKANYASNVRQVLDWVASGNIPYGIVYATDAAIEPGVSVQAVADSSLYDPVIYPAAVISESKQKDGSEAFLQYLKSDDAKELFHKYGFETVS